MIQLNDPTHCAAMMKTIRSESEIFADLVILCSCPGYIHAIAYFCFRDNMIFYKTSGMTESDVEKMFSPKRLIRTEVNTLLGLMVKGEIDWTLPAPKMVQKYVNETERLLNELHDSLSRDFFSELTEESIEKRTFNPFEKGEVWREPIFYGSESAYNFQYQDLAVRKYSSDEQWLQVNKGFTICQASLVAKAVEAVQADSLDTTRKHLRAQHPNEWTVLPFFTFKVEDVSAKAGIAIELVEKVLSAFELGQDEFNKGFNALNDFNVITATPLLRTPSGKFLSLYPYSLSEAIYDSPFFWMAQDKAYLPTLAKNRGEFTENFVVDRLALIFGSEHVFQNVDIFETKAAKVSEIDVLVVWADRVIVVQAKSKRLTLEARKGNDQVIRNDFKKSVQAAYDQGALCANCLKEEKYKLVTQSGQEVLLPENIKEIYLFCVVSDNYPALSFQTRYFLQTQSIDRLLPPLVMDVFALDAITEMLQSPIQFLSYINRRVCYSEQLMASLELPILAFHLKKGLWVEPNVNLMHIVDEFVAELDIAMTVRRTGIQGAITPNGFLTHFNNTTIGSIVKEIERCPEPATVELGFYFLAMQEQAVNEMSLVVDRLVALTRADGKVHDCTFAVKESSGITFHCTDQPLNVAGPRLASYCKHRKYKEKAPDWFGLCLGSKGINVRSGVVLSYPWVYNSIMEKNTQNMQAAMPVDQVIQSVLVDSGRARKIGRNDPCPCGSGLKYKKCCLE